MQDILIKLDNGVEMDFKFNTIDEFKEEFLKRWGNIVANASNKKRKEKQKVKYIVYDNHSIQDILSLINSTTRWRVSYKLNGIWR